MNDNNNFLFKIVISCFVFLLIFSATAENAFAVKCMTATTVSEECDSTDPISDDYCSMTEHAGCDFASSDGNISVCLVGATSYDDDCYGYFFPFCGKADGSSSCSSYRKCQENGCPTDDGTINSGDSCIVSKLESDYTSHITGVWDDNGGPQCITCDGEIEETVCGDVSGTYYTSGTDCDKFGNNKCEFACGAAAGCDEISPNTGSCGGATGCQLTTCDNDGTCEPASGETTVTCPNDCCVNKTCADPAVCSDAINCLTLEPACIGFCIAASAACDPDCGMWECDLGGFVEQCPTPGALKGCAGLDGDVCVGGTWQNCDNGCTRNNAPICWNGAGGCGVIPPGSCVDEYDACGCDCVAGGCNNDGVRNNGETGIDCGGGGCPACLCVPGPITCPAWSVCSAGSQSRTCTNGCVNIPQTKNCCTDTDADSDGNHDDCVGAPTGPICDTSVPNGKCVNCITNDDCAGTDVCDVANNICIPCKGEGEVSIIPLLCCEGLSWWDKNNDGTKVCTSACDPSASFFCNTLRDSVDTIVQGGEKMIGYILGLIGSVALLLVIIAGIMYMTSAGNEEKIASSKKILTGAVIGLGIALLAFSLLQVVLLVLNM